MYVGHFKCNIRTIRDGYPELHRWVRKLYWTVPAFKETCNFAHIKTHYYWSHPMVRMTSFVGGVRADVPCVDQSAQDRSCWAHP